MNIIQLFIILVSFCSWLDISSLSNDINFSNNFNCKRLINLEKCYWGETQEFVIDAKRKNITLFRKVRYEGIRCSMFLETYDVSCRPRRLLKSVNIWNIRDLHMLEFNSCDNIVYVSWKFNCSYVKVPISKSKLLEYDLSELYNPIIANTEKFSWCEDDIFLELVK